MEQTWPNLNISVYKDEVQVEVWLKSQTEKKSLKISKHERHLTLEWRLKLSLTISCLHAFAHI